MAKKLPEPRSELEALRRMKLQELLKFAEKNEVELHGMACLNEELARMAIITKLGGEDY